MGLIKTAVFGAGFVGRIHIEGLRRLGNVEVAALGVGPDDDGPALASELHIPRATSDAAAIFSDPSIAAVHICTPNAAHFPLAKAALAAGKHVLCEKPLAMSVAEAHELTALAAETKLRNCTFHNLRMYPMLQQARQMIAAGALGDLFIVQGTYSQDWLLYNTDWNWRLVSSVGGRSRCLADIGSHWCDAVEHITGRRITSLCADIETFHKTRKRPRAAIATFSGKTLRPDDYEEIAVDTEDYAGVIFRMDGGTRGSYTASQVSAGRKNSFRIEVFGSASSLAWDGERPDELWLGHRNQPNQVMIKDPALLAEGARGYAGLPAGHAEGYGDTFKQLFRRFYHSIENPDAAPEYPQFADGLRQLTVLDAELASAASRAWVDVPPISTTR